MSLSSLFLYPAKYPSFCGDPIKSYVKLGLAMDPDWKNQNLGSDASPEADQPKISPQPLPGQPPQPFSSQENYDRYDPNAAPRTYPKKVIVFIAVFALLAIPGAAEHIPAWRQGQERTKQAPKHPKRLSSNFHRPEEDRSTCRLATGSYGTWLFLKAPVGWSENIILRSVLILTA